MGVQCSKSRGESVGMFMCFPPYYSTLYIIQFVNFLDNIFNATYSEYSYIFFNEIPAESNPLWH